MFAIFLQEVVARVAHDCLGVCALGVARAQADALQFVMGARFGEAT